MLQRQDNFDHAGDPGCRLQMTNIGFDRADKQRFRWIAVLAEHGSNRTDFNWIAQRGARTMRLHVVDVTRREASITERGADHRFLGRAIWNSQPATAPVLISCRSSHHRKDRIAIGDGLVEQLEHEYAAALAARKAVGGGVERLAPAVRRQHVRFGEAD